MMDFDAGTFSNREGLGGEVSLGQVRLTALLLSLGPKPPKFSGRLIESPALAGAGVQYFLDPASGDLFLAPAAFVELEIALDRQDGMAVRILRSVGL